MREALAVLMHAEPAVLAPSRLLLELHRLDPAAANIKLKPLMEVYIYSRMYALVYSCMCLFSRTRAAATAAGVGVNLLLELHRLDPAAANIKLKPLMEVPTRSI